MRLIFKLIFKGIYLEYNWLFKEYRENYNEIHRYNELSPKEIKAIITKYELNFEKKNSKILIFSKVKKIQDVLDGRLKKYQSNTYNEVDRFGDLRLYRFYQFVVAMLTREENPLRIVPFLILISLHLSLIF